MVQVVGVQVVVVDLPDDMEGLHVSLAVVNIDHQDLQMVLLQIVLLKLKMKMKVCVMVLYFLSIFLH